VLEGGGVRLPKTEHTSRAWRIHELTHDFHVEDVWALPTPGGPGDFPKLVRMAASLDPSHASSPVVRVLFEVRWRLGSLLGWDAPAGGLDARVPSLRERMPPDLRAARAPAEFDALPFTPLYLLDDEFAAEIVNRTVHGVVHFGWVEDDAGGYRGQMTVLVKRNGLLGAAYMAAITPFRYLLVYPRMLREIGRTWRAEGSV
jgi:hypothetical protein